MTYGQRAPNKLLDEVTIFPRHPVVSYVRRICEFCDGAASAALIALVRAYQWTLSPLIGRQCRFLPTCSEYFIGAVRKYGAFAGAWRGVRRICRCHPFYRGEWYDPP